MPNPNHHVSSDGAFYMPDFNFPAQRPTVTYDEKPNFEAGFFEQKSNRRRSRSESYETCKRKCRSIRNSSCKRYSNEYENTVGDDRWESREPRHDCCRLRSNLCELPTSYISDNRPLVKVSTLTKVSAEHAKPSFQEVVDYDTKIKNCSEMRPVNRKPPSAEGPRRRTDLFNYNINLNASHSSNKLKNNCSLRNLSRFSPITTKFDPYNEWTSNGSTESRDDLNSKSSENNSVVKEKYYAVLPQRNVYNFAEPKTCDFESSYTSLSYDTSTFFDKHKNDAEDLHTLYSREVDFLRTKLKELRSCTSERRSEANLDSYARSRKRDDRLYSRTEIQLCRSEGTTGSGSEVRAFKTDVIKVDSLGSFGEKSKSPLVGRRNGKVVRLAVKTGKRLSTSKLRKSNQKVSSGVWSKSDDSEGIESDDFSGSEEDLKDTEEEEDDKSSTTSKQAKSYEGLTGLLRASGDASSWPIRESLFPNVPPYIAFQSFDSEPKILPGPRKLFKWKLSTITPILVRKTVVNSGFALVRNSNQWAGLWGKHVKSPMFKTLREFQKLNHFPGTFQLGRKDRLWKNFQKFIAAFGHKEFGFIPQTYILPQELKLLKNNWETRTGGNDWWILKPPASARGAGIKIINKWNQIPKKTSLVIQKYISRPYLIEGNKFDLRLYVLVTSFDPLRIYLYPEGLARFASVKYSSSSKDIKEKYMHLTNYSINKMSSNYAVNDDADACQGHKWTLTKLLEYLQNQGINRKLLWRNLEQLVIKTVIACADPISELCKENMNNRYNCYELFGIDVLLDSRLKPWLLEVNISPSLHSNSSLDEFVKGPLVQDMLNIAQFHLPSKINQYIRPFPQGFDPKLYTKNLTTRESAKQERYIGFERRPDYLYGILDFLSGDDVRHLVTAEDELAACGAFLRVFPTAETHKYLEYMESSYYNKLFDAWETKYESNRSQGIRRLQIMCNDRIHLRIASSTFAQKNSESTIHGEVKPEKEEVKVPITSGTVVAAVDNNNSF